MSIYVFGYGSLISVESASRTLRRKISLSDLIPGYLLSYKRGWTLKDKVFSESLTREIDAVFLNIEKAPGKMLNGVLIKINEEELENLRTREKNYDTFEVTSLIKFTNEASIDPASKAFTFVGKDAYKVSNEDDDSFIMNRYVNIVLTACARLGESFHREYDETTDPAQFRVIDGNYSFVDIKQSKYV
jgi:cation transport regulator ChaC